MDSAELRAFVEEIEKIAVSSDDVAIGLGVASLPLIAYDALKATGHSRAAKALQKEIKGGEVEVTKYMKARAPDVKIVDTPKKVDAFAKKEVKNPITRFFAKPGLKAMIRSGDNAAAFTAESGQSYIFGRGKMPKAVIEHELGHVRDFQDKGLTSGKAKEYGQGFLRGIAAANWKPYYRKTVQKAEAEAWKRVEESDEKARIKALADTTYEKGFHKNRAGAVASTTVPVLLSVLQRKLLKVAAEEEPSIIHRLRKAGPALGAAAGLGTGLLRKRPVLSPEMLKAVLTGTSVGWMPDVLATGVEAAGGKA